MAKRLVRAACVLAVAALTAQGCLFSKSKRGTGTNIGSGFGSDDVPRPTIPAAAPEE